jgi:DNA-binding beta-propeller fold protein YncE
LSRRILIPILAFFLLAVLGLAAWLYFSKSGRPPATVVGWPAFTRVILGAGSPSPIRLDDPFGLTQDAQGNLYLSDAGDANLIRKLAPDGVLTVLAGDREGFADGQGTMAAFNTPSGLAVDPQGNLYVADTGNHAVRKITPQGLVSTLAGTGKPGWRDGPGSQAQFNGPIGVAVDKAGRVYVADSYNDRIRLIEPDGSVKTLAGGDRPGDQDGPALEARFDTPCALLVTPGGDLLVADSGNHALRKLSSTGMVSTLLRGDPQDEHTPLRRPIGLALTHDGFIYTSDSASGRIVQVSPAGQAVALPDGAQTAQPEKRLRLARPAGILLTASGSLLVADQSSHSVWQLSAQAPQPAQAAASAAAAAAALAARQPIAPPRPPAVPPKPFPWPVQPQWAWHEVVGTMGEVRGNFEGESRDHLHAGLDVQADMGDKVLAVARGKVSLALPNWGYGSLSEGLNIAQMAYIHMRVGRTPKNVLLDARRFTLVPGDDGKPERVRVRRGARFEVGDALGTVNRMAHVHLEYNPNGVVENPLLLFTDQQDHVPPRIASIALYDAAGQRLSDKTHGRLRIARGAGPLTIVVDAYDQVDGNLLRRRLGLYKLGYQLLHADGTPLPGYEQPVVNLEFNRLPPDRDAVKTAYWADSGVTVHGAAATRFLYVVTNTLRDGKTQTGAWQPGALPVGDYRLRIFAADFAGNQAVAGRDLAITLE